MPQVPPPALAPAGECACGPPPDKRQAPPNRERGHVSDETFCSREQADQQQDHGDDHHHRHRHHHHHHALCCYGHGLCVGPGRARMPAAVAAARMDPGAPVEPDEAGFALAPARAGGGSGGSGGPAPAAKLAYWRYYAWRGPRTVPAPSPAASPLPPPPPPVGRLLVVWGAFASARHFDDVAAWLAAHGVDVVCFDHRGVGGSGPADLAACRHSAELLAADALAVADAVWGRGADVHVFGASMGGMVAQELALALAERGRLASLALAVTSAGGLCPAWLAPLVRAVLHTRWGSALVHAYYMRGGGTGSGGGATPQQAAATAEAALVRRLMRAALAPAFLEGGGGAVRAHFARHWLERFGELFTFGDARVAAAHTAVIACHRLTAAKAAELRAQPAPILVQVSRRDALVPPAAQRALAKVLGARSLELPGGHMGLAPGDAARFRAALLENVQLGAVLARRHGGGGSGDG